MKFELQKPKAYSVVIVLGKCVKSKKEAESELSELIDPFNRDLLIMDSAISAHKQYCAENPNSPASRMIESDMARMTIYPTDSVQTSVFYKKTYGECKIIIGNTKETMENLRERITTLKRNIESLLIIKGQQDRIGDAVITKNVIDVKVKEHEYEEWQPLEVVMTVASIKYKDIVSMRVPACIVMETITVYPTDDKEFPSYRKVEQALYFHYPDDEERSFWYLDTVGAGNTADFVVVEPDIPYQSFYKSEADFLTSQFISYCEDLHDSAH